MRIQMQRFLKKVQNGARKLKRWVITFVKKLTGRAQWLVQEKIMEDQKIVTTETAKEVAGKSIGKYGLAYITLIVLIGVGSSYFLSEAAITLL